ncbi:uncharacterized protein LOC116385823 isoform X2 [Anarrhichthys ocellatus]|uniref:uncharacterized protein LOC116385823 isoform X2 n=1 Tax=Anarrhichthys ocellatus TaxID=433405 RepID=UPI0012EE2A0B|nr:uncharacterized protein LOC116385823 isoform X2 [Anarrhichthys ocellatus]
MEMIYWVVLISCASGLNVEGGSSIFYRGEKSKNITIKWDSQIKPNISSTNLLCVFQSERNRVLYCMLAGVEVSGSQDGQFVGRVQCKKDVLREGRLRLHMARLRTDDSGNYWCNLTTIFGETMARVTFVLNVTTTKSGLETSEGTKTQPGGPKRGQDKYYNRMVELGSGVAGVAVVFLFFLFGLVISTVRSGGQQQDPDQHETSTEMVIA